MATWKVLSDDALVASAADKYTGYKGRELIVDEELLSRNLTFLKGVTEDANLNFGNGGDESDSGNSELAAPISHLRVARSSVMPRV